MSPSSRLSSQPFRAIVAGLLLILGVQCWLVLGRAYYGRPQQYWLLLAGLVVSCIPFVSRWIDKHLDRLSNPSHRNRAIAAWVIAVLSAGYLIFTAWYQDRAFVPEFVDEHSYAIAMQQAARFRLWMPQHPIADFFEALQLIVHPIYASMYFPGTAMLFAPSVWLGVPFWAWSAMIAGACVGLVFRITAELLDAVAAALIAIMLLGTSMFRLISVMFMAQMPVLLLSMLAVWTWLRWRQSRHAGWGATFGFLAGWALITRPLDSIALLTPVLVATCIEGWSHRPALVRTILLAIFGALPLVALQLSFNHAATGSVLRTPFGHSHEKDYPLTSLGFHTFDPSIKPLSTLPQKHAHWRNFSVGAVEAHQPETAVQLWMTKHLPTYLSLALPHVFMLVLLPLSVLAWSAKRWVLLSPLLIWMALHVLYVFKLPHYVVPMIPAIATMTLCGVDALRNAWPRMRHQVTCFAAFAIVIISFTETAEFNRLVRDRWFKATELEQINRLMMELPEKPAVVLFRYEASISSEVEPVYNTDVAWPDDAEVVRAHDLGERNIEIFRYYAQRQPQRVFYRYDRKSQTLERLGLTTDLASTAAPSSR